MYFSQNFSLKFLDTLTPENLYQDFPINEEDEEIADDQDDEKYNIEELKSDLKDTIEIYFESIGVNRSLEKNIDRSRTFMIKSMEFVKEKFRLENPENVPIISKSLLFEFLVSLKEKNISPYRLKYTNIYVNVYDHKDEYGKYEVSLYTTCLS